MVKFKVSIDRNSCIGDAICTALSANWYMEKDGKANFRKEIIEEAEYGENHEAEVSCPVAVIKIQKISSKQ